MNVSRKLHTRMNGHGIYVLYGFTVRIRPNTGDFDDIFQLLKLQFLASLINRKVLGTPTKDEISLCTSFKAKSSDDEESVERLVDTVRQHLRLLKDQLAGTREEEKDRARMRAA